MTLAFLKEAYFSKASVRTFSVQSFETSDTKRRNHFGSHSVSVGLSKKRSARWTQARGESDGLTHPTSCLHPYG